MAKKKTGKRWSKKGGHKKVRIVRLFLLLVFFCSLIAGGIYITKEYIYPSNRFESDKYFVKGIDVSHHNPILNWENVASQNISFAYLKATEGISHKDRNYIYNYQLAKQAGLKVGGYHFFSFAISGEEQARHFIETLQHASGDLIPAIDVEHSKSNIYSKDAEFRQIVTDELKAMEVTLYDYFGVHPIIYTNNDCYSLYIKGHFQNNALWISDLKSEPNDKISNWRIWQFTHKGKLSGVNEPIDLNYYRYSFQEFQELLLP